jgi:hypothetical protein
MSFRSQPAGRSVSGSIADEHREVGVVMSDVNGAPQGSKTIADASAALTMLLPTGEVERYRS